ncbi:MAG: vitamin K epoxide reductase family protein [Anaerolineales bacterium]|nr:vitamin K epoxide reductase family protein [Anaerolineales bacterium]MDW8161879.1 vitamin K epoxide reductase family protein [Anaerolineales bacterium]
MQSTETLSELWPGWLVLGFVVLALLYGLAALFSNRTFVIPLKRLNLLFSLVCAIGLGVAAYIAYVQLFRVQAICGPLEECNTVLQSRYAKLLGFVPNSVIGLISYLALVFLWVWHARRKGDWLARHSPLLILAITLLGTLLSVYLTILQVLTLRALCIWCLSSAVLITMLFLLSVSLSQSNYAPILNPDNL